MGVTEVIDIQQQATLVIELMKCLIPLPSLEQLSKQCFQHVLKRKIQQNRRSYYHYVTMKLRLQMARKDYQLPMSNFTIKRFSLLVQ